VKVGLALRDVIFSVESSAAGKGKARSGLTALLMKSSDTASRSSTVELDTSSFFVFAF